MTSSGTATFLPVTPVMVTAHTKPVLALTTLAMRSGVPVCAGFGIRSREQVQALRAHVDGVIIGSALVEVLERGGDPARWLSELRG